MAGLGEHRIPIFLAAGILAASGLAWPLAVSACSFGTPDEHTLDPEEERLDSRPPGAVDIIWSDVTRGTDPPNRVECDHTASSCDDIGFLLLEVVPPEDDRTPAESMGYLFEVVDGKLPTGFSFPTGPVRATQINRIGFHWIDGAEQEQESFGFHYTVRAVDLGGNLGPASRAVRFSDPGTGGCTAVGRRTGSLWPVISIILLGLLSGRLGPRP